MPTKWLPESANLEHLKHQAKDLLRDFRAHQMAAFQRVREFHPKFQNTDDRVLQNATFSLSDAQLSIAREYGYASWPRLKAVIAEKHHQELHLNHNDRLPDGPFKQALDFIDAGDEARLQKHLNDFPSLIHEEATFEGGNYFASPTLLEFIPENPNRHARLPKNAIAIAEILLKAGARENLKAMNETVMLAASGRVCREHGVQKPLIELLCRYGADPAAGMHSALAHQEMDAVRVLIECGAPLDLPAAATLGALSDVEALLPSATQEQKQLALALAVKPGHTEIVNLLLQNGADPNRYNPPGGHSHCTPLHSAVASNQLGSVVALVEAGADTTMTDIHHRMSPLGWANYLKFEDVEDYLKLHT